MDAPASRRSGAAVVGRAERWVEMVMGRFFAEPFTDLVACLEAQLVRTKRPLRVAVLIMVSLVVTWWVYVPIHELLHVLGCVATGGSVTQLEIAPMYGGALLSQLFPFVVSGGEYAGRLSGFDWKASDLIYLATDLAPFLVSIFVGVPLVKRAARRSCPIAFGAAVVLGLAPFCNIIGDYYEMGSIITTRVLGAAGVGDGPIAFEALRSDDISKLIKAVSQGPATLDPPVTIGVAAAYAVVGVSAIVGVLLAFMTYGAGAWFARRFTQPATPAGPATPTTPSCDASTTPSCDAGG